MTDATVIVGSHINIDAAQGSFNVHPPSVRVGKSQQSKIPVQTSFVIPLSLKRQDGVWYSAALILFRAIVELNFRISFLIKEWFNVDIQQHRTGARCNLPMTVDLSQHQQLRIAIRRSNNHRAFRLIVFITAFKGSNQGKQFLLRRSIGRNDLVRQQGFIDFIRNGYELCQRMDGQEAKKHKQKKSTFHRNPLLFFMYIIGGQKMEVKISGGILQKFLWIAFVTIGSNRAGRRGLTCPVFALPFSAG